jgi:hypothetical protein
LIKKKKEDAYGIPIDIKKRKHREFSYGAGSPKSLSGGRKKTE